ncbi:nucleotidyltransferase domain-containing protein [Paenibacillus radicis (ex Xue et al. 2023)]|uniref:Nucleotidyltransferase domain-containing protein n=1 Tax=Paenibacillus radicis (ex Xue et al. 2023) TaxID=2972489 RepID=A0ABT1YFM6_9BACL|nr:nucleotidyltransferase domain-containing protein [Paenibacillus radicis (ex Xue et al. 2023)]MCR8631214.1 nucleotidyltransferase domain-containing protein [Paenibacillus radicis (ex Xue et al. 2023)]
MREHHSRSIANLVEVLQKDPKVLALIIAGSIAKGIEREDSDIDVYLVVTDEEFAEREARNDLFYFNKEVCDYSGGYIDGKVIPYSFLEKAVIRGSEPTRASFLGSYAAFSRIEGLDVLLQQIPVYPESNREKNMTDFYAQVSLYGNYFAKKAIEQNNPYLLSHSVSNVVLFAGRMILAYNRVLFPCHKSFMRVVEKAADKPDNFVALANELLQQPTLERITAFVELISGYQDWGVSRHQAVSIFVTNNEWNWLETEPPLQDR